MYNYTDSFIAHFWTKVARGDDSECWLWTAATTWNGRGRLAYGIIGVPPSIAGKPNCTRRAHRISYEISVGPIPAGADLDHICHNARCVNPNHLRVVTRSQNMQNRQSATVRSITGIRGVIWEKRRNKWRVEVRVNKVSYFGGYFTDITKAEKAAVALRLKLMTHNDLDRSVVDGTAARGETR